MKGTVAKFNAKRGFGFIRSDQLDQEIFVHITKVNGRRALRPGQEVTFDTEQTDKGLAAVNVSAEGTQATGQGKPPSVGISDKPGSTSKYLLIGAVVVIIVLAVIYML